MPFEVHVIKSPHLFAEWDENDSIDERSTEDVAADIKAAYEDAAAKDGKIVGSHALVEINNLGTNSMGGGTHQLGRQTLYLVADVPQPHTEE